MLEDLRYEGSNPRNGLPAYLFKVEPRTPIEGEISANFRGITYTIAVDPTGADASSQVLAILGDLVARESSAKSLPPPSAIDTP